MSAVRFSHTRRIVTEAAPGALKSVYRATLKSGGELAVTMPSVLLDAEDVMGHLRELADALACTHDLDGYESAARDEVLRVALALRSAPSRVATLREAKDRLAEYAALRDLVIELVTHWTRAEAAFALHEAN